jgi:hypothetical protein
MKSLIVENTKSSKHNLILLILIVYLVNFTYCLNRINPINHKPNPNSFSSFLLEDTTQNMDDLSMFADLDELSEIANAPQKSKEKATVDSMDYNEEKSLDKVNTSEIKQKVETTKIVFDSKNSKKKELEKEHLAQNAVKENKLKEEKAIKQKLKQENKRKKYNLNSEISKLSPLKSGTLIKVAEKPIEFGEELPTPSKKNEVSKNVESKVVNKPEPLIKTQENKKDEPKLVSLDTKNESPKLIEKKINTEADNVSPFFSVIPKNDPMSDQSKPKVVENKNSRMEVTNSSQDENKKLISELKPDFLQKLVDMQNNVNINNIFTGQQQMQFKQKETFTDQSENEPLIKLNQQNPIKTVKQKEKLNKNEIKDSFKPDELDMSKLSYLNELINKVIKFLFNF